MRILSQDNGKYDLPYENIILEKMADVNTIYAYTSTGQTLKMAVYSSAERMDRAMEMLQKAYSPLFIIKDLGDMVEADIKPNNYKVNRTEPDEIRNNYYFKFPEDCEISI